MKGIRCSLIAARRETRAARLAGMAAATNAAAGEAAGDSNQRRTDGVGQYRAHDQAFEVIDPFINGLSPFPSARWKSGS